MKLLRLAILPTAILSVSLLAKAGEVSQLSDLAGRKQVVKTQVMPLETTRDLQLEKAIRLQIRDSSEYEGSSPPRYYYNRVDLNGDREPEVLVYYASSGICGSGGCPTLIFQKVGQDYQLVSEIALTGGPIIVTDRKTSGWNDLFLPSARVAEPGYYLLRFNGKSYPISTQDGIQVKPKSTIIGKTYLKIGNHPGIAFLPLNSLLAKSQPQLTEKSQVLINGIGAVRAGMTVAQASIAAGTPIGSISGTTPENCEYYKSKSSLEGVIFMVIDGDIARVDVSNPRILTSKGAKIGDTEARIKSLYKGQIKVTPHEYRRGGHYLTVIPVDKSDKNYRIVFETDGKRVTEFRAGRMPEVEYVEGCS